MTECIVAETALREEQSTPKARLVDCADHPCATRATELQHATSHRQSCIERGAPHSGPTTLLEDTYPGTAVKGLEKWAIASATARELFCIMTSIETVREDRAGRPDARAE